MRGDHLRSAIQIAAHRAVEKALKDGTLIKKPCSHVVGKYHSDGVEMIFECKEVKTEAHHVDYTRPLDVVWLCRKHHRRLHADEDRRALLHSVGNPANLKDCPPDVARVLG